MSLARKILGVGLWTAVSRATGFVRDMLVGRFLGAGRLSDIFLTAFRLPNLFRDLLGDGAVSSAFIPIFSREKKNSHFASNVFSWLMLVLLILTIIMEIFMPIIILGMAPGFGPEKLAATVGIARIMFVYCMLVCGVGFLSAVLNAFSDFMLAAAVPILLNIFLILGLIVFKTNLSVLAVAVLIAGLVQMAVLWMKIKKRDFSLRFIRPKLTTGVKQMTRRIGWAFLGTGFYQINVFVGILLASYRDGAVTYLYYSDRMIQLPFAIIGLAAGTVILTKISDAITAKKMSAVLTYQNAATRSSMMFVMPSLVGLFILAEPITRILFEYGQWTHSATIAVAAAIMIQVFTLPLMTTSEIYMNTLYASGDMKTPVKIAAVGLGIGTLVMLLTFSKLGYLCVPFGTVVGGFFRNIQLRNACARRGLYKTYKKTVIAIGVFTVLSLVMGVGLFLAKPLISGVGMLAAILAISVTIYLPSAIICDKIIGK